MKNLSFKYVLVFALIAFAATNAFGQTGIPKELTESPIREQMKYVEEHTRIYENFRAIREDIYQRLNRNYTDTLLAERTRIASLKSLTSDLNRRTDSLNVLLNTTRANLEEMTTTKNSIKVLGIEIKKAAYNTIMWTLIGALALLLVIGFLIFKRNLVVLLRTDKDLKDLKEEFATYRQTSRLAREKVEMDYFRELQKLKGK